MHKNVHITLFVEVGVGTALNADDVDLCSRRKSVFEHTTSFYIAHFSANESGALAGFNVEEFNDCVNVVVKVDTQSVLNVSCCCHKKDE